MAKEKEKELELSATASLSAGDLLNLVKLMSDTNAKTLAEALEKLSPHYKSPEQKDFEIKLREDQRKIEINKLKMRSRQQRLCQHEQGQTGNKRTGEGAFNLLKLPTGETIGVCTYCQKVISSLNPEDLIYFRKAGGTMAESGQLSAYIENPVEAQLARLSPDQRAKVVAARERYKKVSPEQELEEELI